MVINTLHNLEKQGLIIKKLLVPIPILKRQKKKKKNALKIVYMYYAWNLQL